MNFLAGVDEAGLGPLLGPLVVAGVAMSGPPGADPWRLLHEQVSRERTEKGKIRVADSKKVNTGEHGLEHLEHTALAFWSVWRGELPASVAELLTAFGVDTARLAECPWYRDLAVRLPLCADAGAVELQAHRLAQAMRRADLAVLRVCTRVVDAAEFNALIEETHNKSRTHFRVYAQAMADLLDVLPDGGHLVGDRCGGLMHYGPALRRAYRGARVRVLSEQAQESRYEIAKGGKTVRVTFSVQGEDRAFPTALASCFAKYLREVMLDRLNAWFCARVPGLAPTAGYTVDGRRFLSQIETVLAQAAVPRSLLVRSR